MSKTDDKNKKQEFEFISEEGLQTLGTGLHKVKIDKVLNAKSDYGTPQLEVTYKSTDEETKGQTIREWLNLEGYQKNEDGTYVLDDDGKRIHSDENTEAAKRIVGQRAYAVGIEKGIGFNRNDLLGKELGIAVRMTQPSEYSAGGSPFVKAVMSLDKLEEKRAAQAEAVTFEV